MKIYEVYDSGRGILSRLEVLESHPSFVEAVPLSVNSVPFLARLGPYCTAAQASMVGPRKAGFSQFGGLTGDLESGSRKRQGLADARKTAQV